MPDVKNGIATRQCEFCITPKHKNDICSDARVWSWRQCVVHCSELPCTLSKEQLSHPWGSSIKCAIISYNNTLCVETLFLSSGFSIENNLCIMLYFSKPWMKLQLGAIIINPLMATISGCNVLFPLKPTPSATHNPFLTATSPLREGCTKKQKSMVFYQIVED